MEALFEAILLQCFDANEITILSFLGAGSCNLALKNVFYIIATG